MRKSRAIVKVPQSTPAGWVRGKSLAHALGYENSFDLERFACGRDIFPHYLVKSEIFDDSEVAQRFAKQQGVSYAHVYTEIEAIKLGNARAESKRRLADAALKRAKRDAYVKLVAEIAP